MRHLCLSTIPLTLVCLLASAQVPTPADKGQLSLEQAQKTAEKQAASGFDIRQRQRAHTSQAEQGLKAQDRALVRQRKAKL